MFHISDTGLPKLYDVSSDYDIQETIKLYETDLHDLEMKVDDPLT